jgi:hypothetical protein
MALSTNSEIRMQVEEHLGGNVHAYPAPRHLRSVQSEETGAIDRDALFRYS